MTRSIPVSMLLSALVNQPWSWLAALRTHPIAAACCVLGTLLLTVLNLGSPEGLLEHVVVIALMTCGIGFFGALAIEWGLSRCGTWAAPARRFWSIVVLGTVAGTLFPVAETLEARVYPYIFWQSGAVLLALYAAMRPPKDALPDTAQLTGWYGGQRVLLAAFTTGLLALVVGGGVSVALLAIDVLLGLSVAEEAFVQTWILALALMWPLAFLNGVTQALPADPADRPAPPERAPRWVTVAVGWALVPLALVYLVILYVYLVQLVFGWDAGWGSVAVLTAAYLSFGVGAHIAALPLVREGHGLATLYRSLFPWTVPAPLAALSWAIWVRLLDYGMTEPRAILFVVALWLTLLLVVWAIRGANAGPATPVGLLGILMVLAGNGPWGAPEISLISQERNVRFMMLEYDMINEDGHAVPPATPMAEDDQQRLRALMMFFDNRGVERRLAELFPGGEVSTDARLESLGLEVAAAPLTRYLGVSAATQRAAVRVAGYDLLVPLSVERGGTVTGIGAVDDGSDVGADAGAEAWEPTLENARLTVHRDADTEGRVVLDLTPVFAAAIAASRTGADGEADAGAGEAAEAPSFAGYVTLPPDSLMVEAAGSAGWRARLVLQDLTLTHTGTVEDAAAVSLQGMILLDDPASGETAANAGQ